MRRYKAEEQGVERERVLGEKHLSLISSLNYLLFTTVSGLLNSLSSSMIIETPTAEIRVIVTSTLLPGR